MLNFYQLSCNVLIMHDYETTIEHHKWKHKDVLDDIDIKINILCDQILFNPSEETITITSCQLENGHHQEPFVDHSKKLDVAKPNPSEHYSEKCSSSELTDDVCIERVSDVICFGSTIVIFLLLLIVLIFMMNKDHENPF